jgi:hypothetical protein
MEAARTSETSVDNYFTRQYIPEDNSELQANICMSGPNMNVIFPSSLLIKKPVIILSSLMLHVAMFSDGPVNILRKVNHCERFEPLTVFINVSVGLLCSNTAWT